QPGEQRRRDAELISEPVRDSPQNGRPPKDGVVQVARQTVELGMHEVVEMVDHPGQCARPPELGGQGRRHSIVARPLGRRQDEDAGTGGGHEPGRRATSRVSLPAWRTSPYWFRIFRSSITTPPPLMTRFASVFDALLIVSPTQVSLRNAHSKPMNASTTSGGWGTRQPRPDERQRGSRS